MTFTNENIKNEIQKVLSFNVDDRQFVYRRIINHIDLTTLEGTDNDEKVRNLCKTAYEIQNTAKDIPAVAAICVYPIFVKTAKEALVGKTSTLLPWQVHSLRVKALLISGWQKFVTLLNKAPMKSTWLFREVVFCQVNDFIREEVSKHKEACGNAHLKVIWKLANCLTQISFMRHQ